MTREVTQSSQPVDDELLRLFDLSLDFFCIAGFDGYFKRVNRAFVQTLGYPEEELLATPFLDITHPDDRERARQALSQLAAGEDIVGFETRVICADGSVRWLEWNTSTRPDEGFVFGVARDVTDRRLDNAQLDALRRLATLVAEGVEPQELFAVVAEEVARVIDVSLVSITRYEPDGTATECANFASEGLLFPVGKRWSLEGTNVTNMIRESPGAARINDYSGLQGEIAEALRRSGVRSTVGVPIVVAQRLWGVMVVSSREPDPLPESIETRLAGFTELLAVAIESAESRDAVSRLAEEQAALRRVATLVAQGAPPHELFAAAAKEVEHVFGLCPTTSDVATVVRFDPGSESVLVGMSKSIEGLPLESRWEPKDLYVSTRVARTWRSARVDAPDLDAVDDPDADALRTQRLFSQVGSPIVVDGRLWGAMTINAYERLPADTEERLEKFTELVATAIANSDSRGAVAQLAGEQAALRRVATLVAQGVRPGEMFSAVTEAVARVIDVPAVSIARYEEDGTATELSSFSPEGPLFAVGSRWSLEGTSVLRLIRESSAPARIDDYSGLEGEIAELARRNGLRSTVGIPIVVAERLWGAMLVSGTQQLPHHTELRLASFTELLATAIENAESGEELELLADEQAALRRVATLVAGGAPPQELFAAVAEEVGSLLPVGGATMWRFGPEGTVTTLAAWSTGEVAFPADTRWSTEGRNVPGMVYRTGRPARLDDFSHATGPIGRRAKEAGYRSAVGSPITVQGRLWGAITAASFAEEPLPADTEARLASFTELVATAIANAESHDAVARLAEEQAALRRVAVLVAQGVPPAEIFSAVSTEVDRLFRLDEDATDVAGVIRIDPGPEFVVVGTSRTVEAVPLGSRWEPRDLYASTRVLRTGRSARVDEGDLAAVGGPDAEHLRSQGFLCQVASPILVEGCLWGAVTIDAAAALPPDTEKRLERFGELVATAIANVESRDAAARLTEEQTALRRVAMLVAQGVPPAEIFSAVSNEVERLFRLEGDPTAVGAVIRIDPGPEFVLAGASRSVDAVPVGLRWGPKDLYASTRVLRTGRSARVDEAELDALGGPDADFMRRQGYLSQVASPIVVEGRLWGVITMNASDVLAADTERRLENFGELVATAIANVEAREAVSRLVDEQAALRRMATLVAVGAAPNVVFDAVISEANELLSADGVALSRYEPDDEIVVVANCGLGASEVPPGTRIKHEGENVTSLVRRTGEPARLEQYPHTETSMSRLLRSLGIRAAVGAPIVVGGRLWGVMLARWSEDVSPPADTEERLARFAQVVDTAIANAAAREENERLADGQAALRRVATLVAQQATAEETFAAVAAETTGLLGAERGAVLRFEPEEMCTLMAYASSDDSRMPLGTQLALDGDNIVVDVWRSGRASRRDDDEQSTGAAAALRRQAAVQPRSTIGVPIEVERRPWGAIFVSTSHSDGFAPGAEQRLLDFSELVATAIANAESRSELAASRARIVTASDDARRRIERDLHDGAQQRLVSLALELRAAAERVPVEVTELKSELLQVADGLMSALDDLRELSRGIHPAILAEGGLGPALKSLARRSLVPAEVEVSRARFPEPIEVAAYYVVSEALVNAAKHASASVVRVAAVKHGDILHLSVRDDGLGGADPAKGSGLIGLRDRVEALGGSIDVSSRVGEGTQVVVELPVQPATFVGTAPDESVTSS